MLLTHLGEGERLRLLDELPLLLLLLLLPDLEELEPDRDFAICGAVCSVLLRPRVAFFGGGGEAKGTIEGRVFWLCSE